MYPLEFLILIESYSKILSLFILVITSFVFGYYIPYRLETKIEELESELKGKWDFWDGLHFDYDQFQNWEAKGLALRDTISILEAVNIIVENEAVSKLITRRYRAGKMFKAYSLMALSAKLNQFHSEIPSWTDPDISDLELEKKKKEISHIWNKKRKSTMSEINSLAKSIKAQKRKKTKIVLGILVFQSLGTYLSFIGSQ